MGGEIFRTLPERPLGPPRLLYNWVLAPSGGKAATDVTQPCNGTVYCQLSELKPAKHTSNIVTDLPYKRTALPHNAASLHGSTAVFLNSGSAVPMWSPISVYYTQSSSSLDAFPNLVLLSSLVARLVEALRYKPEGRGFDSRLCQWNFSLT